MQNDPKLKVVIIGAGISGLSTAVELLDQGYQVEMYDQRPHIGGKVASWVDKDGNHIEVRPHLRALFCPLGCLTDYHLEHEYSGISSPT